MSQSAQVAKPRCEETETYADEFPIGNPDVWYAPDLHNSRSRHYTVAVDVGMSEV